MKTGWVVAILLLLVAVALFLLYKFEILNKAVLFVITFFVLFSVLLMIVFKTSSFMKKQEEVKENTEKKNFRYVLNRINEELKDMPDEEVLVWEKGKGVNTWTRDFTDTGGKVNRFVALQGSTKYSRKEVVVFYNLTEDRFWDWRANPSPQLLSNPFLGFEPYQRSGGGGGMGYPYGYGGRYGRYGYPYKPQPKGVHVTFGDEEPPRDEVDAFAENVNFEQI